MKSWQTTLFGILAAAAGGVANTYPGSLIGQIAGFVFAAATGALGYFARDNNKSSESVGAKDSPK